MSRLLLCSRLSRGQEDDARKMEAKLSMLRGMMEEKEESRAAGAARWSRSQPSLPPGEGDVGLGSAYGPGRHVAI